jgi:hypothetical protein
MVIRKTQESSQSFIQRLVLHIKARPRKHAWAKDHLFGHSSINHLQKKKNKKEKKKMMKEKMETKDKNSCKTRTYLCRISNRYHAASSDLEANA